MDVFLPTKINGLTNIANISTGFGHSIVMDSSGNVFSFGSNIFGQMGFPKNILSSNIPIFNPYLKDIVKIYSGSNHNLLIDNKNFLYLIGLNTDYQLGVQYNLYNYINETNIKIQLRSNLIKITCGYLFTLFFGI
jgi:hypothetical protein